MNAHLITDEEINAALAADEPIGIEAASARLEALQGRFNAAIAQKQGIELALAMKDRKPHPGVSDNFIAKAELFKELARKPRKAEAELERLAEEMEELHPQLLTARDRLQTAREAVAAELAAAYRPRHRVAVAGIAAALEKLSAAVAAEQALHAEFQTEMPGFALPDFGASWRAALLGNPRSLGSEWVRTAKKAGLLA